VTPPYGQNGIVDVAPAREAKVKFLFFLFLLFFFFSSEIMKDHTKRKHKEIPTGTFGQLVETWRSLEVGS